MSFLFLFRFVSDCCKLVRSRSDQREEKWQEGRLVQPVWLRKEQNNTKGRSLAMSSSLALLQPLVEPSLVMTLESQVRNPYKNLKHLLCENGSKRF